jgi:hypothetical protein
MKKRQKKSEKQYLSNTFDHAKDSPTPWLMQAKHLKKAADKICWIDSEHQPVKNSDVDFLFPIYRMLLGLSFENLLKGIIIAEGNYNKANDCF